MKKIFAFIAGLLAITIHQPTHAQQNDSKNQSLLWRISGKNLSKPSYLFGTIHLICKDDYLWTETMKQMLSKSDKVCFEMDLDDQGVMTEVATGLMDMSGKHLKDYFTPDQYQLLKQYFKDTLSLDVSMFDIMKPVALQTMLTTGDSHCANTTSYEETIMATAIKDKKEILGLEDPKEQIAVLESIPTDSVIQQILDVIEHKSTDNGEFDELVAAYKKQDLPELYKLITKSKDLGDNMNAFLDDRNKKWIVRMPVKMKESSVFFAVGAGHLWGTNGVINLLRKDGYTVEAVK